jgi:hypothetical protein
MGSFYIDGSHFDTFDLNIFWGDKVSLCQNYRKGEEFAVSFLDDFFQQPFLETSRKVDLSGVDLVSEDRTIGIYVRTRLQKYPDITFNGSQALSKLQANILKYDKFFAVLQLADGDDMDSGFHIQQQYLIDLKAWVQDTAEKQKSYNDAGLIQKTANGKSFFVWVYWSDWIEKDWSKELGAMSQESKYIKAVEG